VCWPAGVLRPDPHSRGRLRAHGRSRSRVPLPGHRRAGREGRFHPNHQPADLRVDSGGTERPALHGASESHHSNDEVRPGMIGNRKRRCVGQGSQVSGSSSNQQTVKRGCGGSDFGANFQPTTQPTNLPVLHDFRELWQSPWCSKSLKNQMQVDSHGGSRRFESCSAHHRPIKLNRLQNRTKQHKRSIRQAYVISRCGAQPVRKGLSLSFHTATGDPSRVVIQHRYRSAHGA